MPRRVLYLLHELRVIPKLIRIIEIDENDLLGVFVSASLYGAGIRYLRCRRAEVGFQSAVDICIAGDVQCDRIYLTRHCYAVNEGIFPPDPRSSQINVAIRLRTENVIREINLLHIGRVEMDLVGCLEVYFGLVIFTDLNVGGEK